VILDAAGTFAYKEGREPLDCLLDNFRPSGDGALAEAGNASVGLYFHKKVVAVLDGVLSCGKFPDRQSAGGRIQRDTGQQIASAE
jgi:hypothetical protein